MDTDNIKHNLGDAARLLKAMSNARRLEILCALDEGEKCVGTLQEICGLSQSALSQHLALLRREGIVKTRRESQTIFYSVNNSEVKTVMDCLSDVYCPTRRLQ